MRRCWWVALWFVLISCVVAAAEGLVPIPPLAARVVDLTATLTPSQREELENRLAAIERDTGAQFAILLLPTTRPETIEQFGIRLAEAWRLGRRGSDDGLIVIVAKEDRTVRIEVGYGLEGVIPDAVAKRVIEEVMVPRFRAGDFHGGLRAAVAALEARLRGEPLARPPSQEAAKEGLPLEWLAIAMVVATLLRLVLGTLGGVLIAGVFAFLVYVLTASWLVALIAFFIVLAGSFGRGGRVWTSGGGFGGGSGGGFGGGGFSGGGGSFGGGGASGRW